MYGEREPKPISSGARLAVYLIGGMSIFCLVVGALWAGW